MSFMTQGSDDDALRDEPDLGDSDGEQVANGDVDDQDPTELPDDDNNDNPIKDESVDAGDEEASQRTASLRDELAIHSPQPPAPTGRDHGAFSDAESIPDDSPSVQVRFFFSVFCDACAQSIVD